ncbi:hypothetical protein ABN028_19660 [Actinopolymorpha sp. B17G11]|uniref:hypothetical protein n=1 Tax=Actinopolymorpha sp. B17G11 TaxID=3160861 RepID=UPI0032E3C5C8
MGLRDELLAEVGEQFTIPTAQRLAHDTLGPTIAARIQWDADGNGTLTDGQTTLTLRCDDEVEEPMLLVGVPCPYEPDCRGPAWDRLSSVRDLVDVIDRGSCDDPLCDVHDEGW